MHAAAMFRRGVIPAEIARRLGVSHQVVSEWRMAWRQGGRAALRGAGRAGRRPKLSRVQLAKVEKTLLRGAEAGGYVADVWTLPRGRGDRAADRRHGPPRPRVVHPARSTALELAAHRRRIVGRRAGVERVHAHLLRRTTATYLHARGVPLATIKAILGHATIGYIDATALDTLEVAREAMRDAFTEIRRAGAGSPDPSRPI